MKNKLRFLLYSQNTNIYKVLTKFSLSLMNSSVTAYGYMMTAPVINPIILTSILSGNTLMAMSSQVMGQIVEIDEDKKMLRTKNRPLPSSLLSIPKAKKINLSLWALSNLVLYCGHVEPLSILMSNVTYASYYVYLKIKPISKLNTFFGAVVGSLPLMIGMIHNINPIDLGTKEICDLGYLFFWQFLHFYGIVVIYKEDYKKTNFKMEINDNKLFALFMIAAISMGVISYIKLNEGTNGGFLRICQSAFLCLHAAFLKYIFDFWKSPTPQTGKIIKHFAYILFFAYFILSPIIIKQSNIKKQREEEKKKKDKN